MIADPGTRCEHVSARADELLPSAMEDEGTARDLPAGSSGGGEDPFAASRARFAQIVGWLDAEQAAGFEHAELESRLELDGRELLRTLLQDHLDLRAARERRAEEVADADGVARGAVEAGHDRRLGSVFGQVTVSRLAYRARGQENLHIADGLLNLPLEQASHGVRRLAAIGSAAGSFDHALGQVRERTGLAVGKRQVEELAVRAAIDFDSFYRERVTAAEQQQDAAADQGPAPRDVLVLSADGKGIVMLPGALREATARAAARASPKLKTRLSKGEKPYRKRIAEVGAVYEIAPAPRTAADVLASANDKQTPAPKAKRKWLTASVVDDAAAVIADIFDEAERRDPDHTRTWVVLVDGNNHQIDRVKAEAKRRKVTVTIIVDLVHVLEYLWKAAWCFFKEADPAAEQWVHEKALSVLEGHSGTIAAAIRRKATRLRLTAQQRANADRTAAYLHNKKPYLRYDTALHNGWPIATGVIEGACRHLVKDRMDITGARWGLQGAEAILKLRALVSNGDFNDYWTYHLAHERHRNHDQRYANSVIPRPA